MEAGCHCKINNTLDLLDGVEVHLEVRLGNRRKICNIGDNKFGSGAGYTGRLDDGSWRISFSQVRDDGTGTILEGFLMMWAFPRTEGYGYWLGVPSVYQRGDGG